MSQPKSSKIVVCLGRQEVSGSLLRVFACVTNQSPTHPDIEIVRENSMKGLMPQEFNAKQLLRNCEHLEYPLWILGNVPSEFGERLLPDDAFTLIQALVLCYLEKNRIVRTDTIRPDFAKFANGMEDHRGIYTGIRTDD